MIGDAFRGKRVVLSGVTGFLGQALLERMLRCLPQVEAIYVLIRPSGRRSAAQRLNSEVLSSGAFARLRAEIGTDALRALVATKVVAIAADLSQDGLGLDPSSRELLSQVDLVIHGAAVVEFDNPVDLMVKTNLDGTLNLLEVVRSARPKFVHVSTAYVGGMRNGLVREVPRGGLSGDVILDWRAEREVLASLRDQAERQSRSPDVLAKLHSKAQFELGPAGAPAVGRQVERLRQRWVDDGLVELGRTHARTLGWPDSYAMTKALTEQALIEVRGEVPLAIVRPSIIESSLSQPQVGWLEGFRVAEPLIMAFGRGLLDDFPATIDSLMDIVPVDLVVGAVLAVAGRSRGWDEVEVFQVASGARNPLRMGELHDIVREYFVAHPLVDRRGQEIALPTWSFPRREDYMRRLDLTLRAVDWSDRLVRQLPLGSRGGRWSSRLGQFKADAQRLRNFAELYGIYASMDAVFDDQNTMALLESLDPTDQRQFNFDAGSFTWDDYLKQVHLPAVMRLARVDAAHSRRRPKRVASGQTVESAPRSQLGLAALDARRGDSTCVAAFDVDGTVLRSNVVEFYLWLRLRQGGRRDWLDTLSGLALQAARLWRLEQQSRSEFQRAFYRQYAGMETDRLRQLGQEALDRFTRRRMFPDAVRRIQAHKAAGHQVLLLTGALDFIVEPLASSLGVDLLCAKLRARGGRYLGELEDIPATAEARAELLGHYARQRGANLAHSFAYADSLSDLPMLEAVGQPTVVNPDPKLLAVARQRGWRVESWQLPKGNHALPIPLSWQV